MGLAVVLRQASSEYLSITCGTGHAWVVFYTCEADSTDGCLWEGEGEGNRCSGVHAPIHIATIPSQGHTHTVQHPRPHGLTQIMGKCYIGIAAHKTHPVIEIHQGFRIIHGQCGLGGDREDELLTLDLGPGSGVLAARGGSEAEGVENKAYWLCVLLRWWRRRMFAGVGWQMVGGHP